MTRGDDRAPNRYFRESLVIRRKVSGRRITRPRVSENDLATLAWNTGDLAGAESLFRRSLATFQKTRGAERPDVASGLTTWPSSSRTAATTSRPNRCFAGPSPSAGKRSVKGASGTCRSSTTCPTRSESRGRSTSSLSARGGAADRPPGAGRGSSARRNLQDEPGSRSSGAKRSRGRRAGGARRVARPSTHLSAGRLAHRGADEHPRAGADRARPLRRGRATPARGEAGTEVRARRRGPRGPGNRRAPFRARPFRPAR